MSVCLCAIIRLFRVIGTPDAAGSVVVLPDERRQRVVAGRLRVDLQRGRRARSATRAQSSPIDTASQNTGTGEHGWQNPAQDSVRRVVF